MIPSHKKTAEGAFYVWTKKRSMMHSEIRPKFSISITASKRTATPRKEAIRTMNSAEKTF